MILKYFIFNFLTFELNIYNTYNESTKKSRSPTIG